jgi:hypothetical protein
MYINIIRQQEMIAIIWLFRIRFYEKMYLRVIEEVLRADKFASQEEFRPIDAAEPTSRAL